MNRELIEADVTTLEPELIDDTAPANLVEREQRSWDEATTDAWMALSENARKTYGGRMKLFAEWCARRGASALPAEVPDVVDYLRELGTTDSPSTGRPVSSSTLTTSRTAIAWFHRARNLPNPCDDQRVRLVMAALTKMPVRRVPPRQARGLSLEDIARIADMADVSERMAQRHDATWGEIKRAETDRFDLAMVELMFTAGLRRSEAAAACWSDVDELPDGTGSLTIRRSKTDQYGQGAVKHIGAIALQRIRRIRPGEAGPGDPILGGIVGATINVRIQRCMERAGLGNGYSGHSARVGMAQEMVAEGASTAEIMQEGRWDSPAMVARYTQKLDAGRGAMARLQRKRNGRT